MEHRNWRIILYWRPIRSHTSGLYIPLFFCLGELHKRIVLSCHRQQKYPRKSPLNLQRNINSKPSIINRCMHDTIISAHDLSDVFKPESMRAFIRFGGLREYILCLPLVQCGIFHYQHKNALLESGADGYCPASGNRLAGFNSIIQRV